MMGSFAPSPVSRVVHRVGIMRTDRIDAPDAPDAVDRNRHTAAVARLQPVGEVATSRRHRLSASASVSSPALLSDYLFDGRAAIGAQTRSDLIDAIVALISEGVPTPKAREITIRAGVSARSFYNHYDSIPDLLLAALEREASIHRRDLFPIPSRARIDKRIEALCRQRRFYFEAMGSLFRATPFWAYGDERLRAFLTDDRRLLGCQLADTFCFELGAAGSSSAEVFAELELGTGWEHWRLLRQSNSPTSAERAVVNATWKLLG